MKAIITKDALTEGIKIVSGVLEGTLLKCPTERRGYVYHEEFYLTKTAAIARVEEMSREKSASLSKQLWEVGSNKWKAIAAIEACDL